MCVQMLIDVQKFLPINRINQNNSFSSSFLDSNASVPDWQSKTSSGPENVQESTDIRLSTSFECSLDEQKAAHLESHFVHQVYDKIADHFSHTRYRAWPQVKSFVQLVQPFDSLLDVGSGNGKSLPTDDQRIPWLSVACDVSAALLRICMQRNLPCVQADCLRLPFRDESFDASICIAVLHHLANEKRRLQAINEIGRILRVDGQALVYVWAFEQKNDQGYQSAYISRGKMDKKDSFPGNQPVIATLACDQNSYQLPVHRNGTSFKQQDMFVPWTDKRNKSQPNEKATVGGKQELRYYHLFRKGELEELIERIPTLRIQKSYYDNGNWAVQVQKTFQSNVTGM